MKNRNKIATAITSLIRKTQDGAVQWKVSSRRGDSTIPANEGFDQNVYHAEIAGRVVRLYGYTRRDPADGLVEEVALEVSDENRESWWTFPDHPAIADLLEAVKYRTVGVEQFIEKLTPD